MRKQTFDILTVGHSTRSLPDFIGLLKSFKISQLIDVRSIPRSRFNPQFNKSGLAKALRSRGIGYRHMKGLGGLRRALAGSINTGWQNPSFRGYADYMQTAAFDRNLDKLLAVAKKKKAAIMCAEALPWRCHRSLIADALLVRGKKVGHIFSSNSLKPHKLTSFARVRGQQITYPAKKS